MANFCSNCGAQVNPGDKFCMNCGSPLTSEPMPSQIDSSNKEKISIKEDEEAKVTKETVALDKGQKLQEESEFEPEAKSSLEQVSTKTLENEKVVNNSEMQNNHNYKAVTTIGETALENKNDASRYMDAKIIPGPFKVIGDSTKRLFQSIKALFKDPKKMIPMLIIALVWIVLDILKACNINPVFTQILSFITFASGGMNGGIIGAIGGIIGKGIFAGAFTILIGLFSKKNKGEKKSFGEIIKGAFSISLNTLFASLTGIGCAILLFLFISGGATRISFMGGIAMMLVFAKAAIHNGFLQKFISSIFYKGKTKAGCGVQGFVRGMALGSALSAFIGLIGINLIFIIIGCLLVASGAVMMILQVKGVIKLGKEENTK